MKITPFITQTSLLIATLALSSCEEKSDTSSKENEKKVAVSKVESEPECCHTDPLKAGEATEESIYQLKSKWQNSQRKEIDLSSLSGKVQVMTMGYTTCQFACPKLLSDMLTIKSKLSAETKENVGFVFVSIDPEVDTPKRLKEYSAENELDAEKWTFLSGETSSVQELAVVLGVKYRKTSPKDFAHSNVIIVLSANGEILHRQEGLNGDPTETVQIIEKHQH